MEQSFRFLVMAGFTYIAFLCVIRLVMGTQYKSKSFLINIIAMITVYGSLLVSRYGNFLKLPEWLCYVIPLFLTVLLPPLALKLKSQQTLKYFIFSIIAVPVIHLCFSFLLGWGEFIPFIKIPSLWDII